MADTGYSLIDENGIEWKFPEGFDRERARVLMNRHNTADERSPIMKAVDWATEPTAAGTYVQTGANQTANAIEGVNREPVHRGLWDTITDLPGIVSDIGSGMIHNPVATMRGGVAGIEQGIGDVAAAQSSPAALAAMAAGPAGKLVKSVPALARIVRTVGAGANATLATKGAQDALTAPDAEGKIMGVVQAALGAHGVGTDPTLAAGARRGAVKTGEMMTNAADSAVVRNTLRAGAVGATGGMMATGHPGAAAAAIPAIVLPEAMRYAGGKLIKFGQGTSGVVPSAASIGTPAPQGRGVFRDREGYVRPQGESTQEAVTRSTEPSAGNIGDQVPQGEGANNRGREGYVREMGESAQEAAKRLADQQKADLKTALMNSADQPIMSTSSFLADLKKLDPEDAKAVMAARDAAKGVRAKAAQAPAPDLQTTGKMEDALASQPAFIDSLPAPETLSLEDIQKGAGTVTPEWGRTPSGRGVDPRIAAIGEDAGATGPNAAAAAEGATGPFSDVQSKMMQALLENGSDQLPEGFSAEGSGPTDQTGPLPGPAIGELPPKQLTGEVDNGLPAGAEVEGSGPTDVTPAAPPNAGGSLGIEPQSFEEALAAASEPGLAKQGTEVNLTEPNVVPDTDPRLAGPVPAEAMPAPLAATQTVAPVAEKPRVRVAPIETLVEPSRSRRGKAQMSATKGYTLADMAAAGLDPSKPYTHITPEQGAAMKTAREARKNKYYAAALQDKAAREAEAGM